MSHPSLRRAELTLIFSIGLVSTALWHAAAQVRYEPVVDADVVGMRAVHWFTADAKHQQAQFEWSFFDSDFHLKDGLGPIPAEVVSKLLPPGATAEEIRGKWKLTQPDGETGQRLVLTDIRAGDVSGRKEVQLPIKRTAAGVICVGEPESVFAQGRNNVSETPEARPGTTRLELRSGAIQPGLVLRENQPPVHWFHLTAELEVPG